MVMRKCVGRPPVEPPLRASCVVCRVLRVFCLVGFVVVVVVVVVVVIVGESERVRKRMRGYRLETKIIPRHFCARAM